MVPVLAMALAANAVAACAGEARLPVAAGIGPDPALPEARWSLIPTVNIAPAAGWPAGSTMSPRLRSGMFVGQHGSWNRKSHSGYKVIFVPFEGGRPTAGPVVDVPAGFLTADGRALGRPVGVALDKSGSLLVADDVGNIVWRVSAVTAGRSP